MQIRTENNFFIRCMHVDSQTDAKIDRIDKYWKMASERDAKRCY